MNTWVNIGITKIYYFDILYIFVCYRKRHTEIFQRMKELLKNTGLIVILIGVIILGYVVFTQVQTNSKLALSAVLIVGGLLLHIFINKYVK